MSIIGDPARLDAVRRSTLVGRDGGPGLQAVVDQAAAEAGVPIALVSLVGSERQWHPAVHGDVDREINVGDSLCAAAIETGPAPLVVADLAADPRWRHIDGIRFYAGRPLAAPDGQLLGTLCVMDSKPRDDGPRVLAALERLARWAELELFADASREREAELGRLQDAIVATTAHELRTPLTTIRTHAELLADDASISESARQSAREIATAAMELQAGGEALLRTLRNAAGGAEAALRERLQLGGDAHR